MDLLLALVRDYASVFTAGLKASTHPHGQNEAKARVAIYYARTASGPVPVKSAKDPEFTAIVAGNAQAFQGAGTSRAVDAGGLDWSCFEGSRDDLAHTICVTPKYGRVVEVQYVNAGRVDRIALDAFLAGVGEGVAALRK